MTDAEVASRWARRFVLAGAGLLVLWRVGAVAGVARRTAVVLGLVGFVFHTVFGKAYSLVPAYFDRDLATTRLMPVHLALSLPGTLLLALDAEVAAPLAGAAGSVLWAAAVAVFLGTILWTVRGNLAGRETATGEANADRRGVDRAANAAVPVALAYLVAGSYGLLAGHLPLPALVDGYPPRVSHLLTAGAAALLLFAVGFRLLPRFLVASPPRPLVAVVLPAGAVGPAVLAAGLPAGSWFRVGAVVEAAAVVGFAAAVGTLYVRSARDRVGFYGLLAGAAAGVLAALLGLSFAFDSLDAALVAAHLRLNLLGFLGLSIVGVTYQFYPPAVGTFRGAGDRTAFAAIALLAGGLLVEVAGVLAGVDAAVAAGRLGALAGASLHAYLLGGLFRERYG